MEDYNDFDFPCSTTWRDHYDDRPRRIPLPKQYVHGQGALLAQIRFLQDENHRLRLALDVAQLTINSQALKPSTSSTDKPSHVTTTQADNIEPVGLDVSPR